MQRFKITIYKDTGIANQMRNYCAKYGISIWSFLVQTICDELSHPLDFSIAEIESLQKRPYKKGARTERFDCGISDAIVLEKLRIIKEDYGIPLNTFFVYAIQKKLNAE